MNLFSQTTYSSIVSFVFWSEFNKGDYNNLTVKLLCNSDQPYYAIFIPLPMSVTNNYHVHAHRYDMSINRIILAVKSTVLFFFPWQRVHIQRREIILVRQTYKARPLQRRRGGAQHSKTYVIVDDAGTLEV